MSFNQQVGRAEARARLTMVDMLEIHLALPCLAIETRCSERRPSTPGEVPFFKLRIIFQSFFGVDKGGTMISLAALRRSSEISFVSFRCGCRSRRA